MSRLDRFKFSTEGPYGGYPEVTLDCYMPECHWSIGPVVGLQEAIDAASRHWKEAHSS